MKVVVLFHSYAALPDSPLRLIVGRGVRLHKPVLLSRIPVRRLRILHILQTELRVAGRSHIPNFVGAGLHLPRAICTSPRWLREAGAAILWAARHVEFEHVYLQITAAREGMGVALASLPLIGREIAAGRLVCPIAAPRWRASDYAFVTNVDRAGDAVRAFEQWITTTAHRP